MRQIIWICLLGLLLFGRAQDQWEDRFQEFSGGKDQRALFPSIFNLATNADIRATSTCGRNGPEDYCKLTEHVYQRVPQCDVCNAHDSSKWHPISFAIDGTKKWWQSPTLSNGLGYEKVNITIDLRQEFQVAYVIIKAGISPRPGTWVLEKSLDGVNYTPWQYYARSDLECMRVFSVPASVGVPKFVTDSDVICTSYFSKLDPMERGEIHTSLVNGRPSAEHPSAELQAFTRTRFVRLRLLSLRTMNADLMIINKQGQEGSEKLDDSVTRRYFYSISDISIGGQCICNGHAEHCNVDIISSDVGNMCECRHNTYGPSCAKCLPLYNQLPWRPGTHHEPNVCEACQCFNHAESCVYDEEIDRQKLSVTPEGKYEGGGRCVECMHNTEGVNCEKCRDEFYRPVNVSHYSQDACRPCYCNLEGSEHSQCVRDASSAPEGLLPGDCICKHGFGGPKCDRCAPGFRNFPACEPCPCNAAGSRNFETCEESSCICKDNVEGIHCDICKPGTIYLSKDNPQGCQPCFCFGKSTECVEKQWSTAVLTTNNNWNLTDLYGQTSLERKDDTTNTLLFNSDDYPREQQHNIYYWKAPARFLGDRLNSYGSNLHYSVYYVPSQHQGHPVPIADVILEGNGLKLEFYSHINFFPRENISVTVPFKPTSGWFSAETRRPINKADLMRVLANVDKLYVRARYHQVQSQSSIYSLRLEYAVQSGDATSDVVIVPSLTKLHPIEVCTCPEHFEGLSCQACSQGYRRVANQLYGGECVKCECNGHSDECDPFTGHCINCQHQTTGPQCLQCLSGHYGNPSLQGVLGTCKPCACPTAENSHSSSCILSQLALDGGVAANQEEFVCTACGQEYEGNKCEFCADGYYGDAETGNCTACECNDNTDPMAIGNCDRKSGVCTRCIGGTGGDHCEVCKENHWGTALQHDCRACNCHHLGAVSSQCNNQTGYCTCVEGYTGPYCDRCLPGHGDIENLCPECNCSPIGALGTECDEQSGQCECRKGVFGKKCDRCIPGYFDLTTDGCQFCDCNHYGSIKDNQCNNQTGECSCLPNVVGQKCESCASGFFNITSNEGCQACECDPLGAVDETCDLMSGQCRCKPGVSGIKCDQCAPLHWGLDESGCKQCKPCPAPGQVCDSVTGECVCPPNTQGEICQFCTKNAWNHDPYRGCQLCDCNDIGSDSGECDAQNGQCKCKEQYSGRKCDLCNAGFFNFPNCEACKCDLAGTDESQCRGDSCLCSPEGQCKCKKNAAGLKCDQCAPNTFSLDKHNPFGCTECFCFNRTGFCVQHNVVWSQVYAPDRRVKFDTPFEYFNRRHNIHILNAEPLNYNSYPTNFTPLYWPLPSSFTGDRTTSYNGFIRFRIVNDDNYRNVPKVRPDPASFYLFPQVLLVGNHRLELEHVPSEISPDGLYKVRLHETQWRNRVAPQIPVSRKQLMIALQNVQGIYVRGTYNEMFRGDEISIQEVSLDVAAEETEAGIGSTALGVESCDSCPEGYAGLSCQNAIRGHCRKRLPGYLNDPDELALVGISNKCSCNSHSENCDPETCRCLDCEHSTIGDSCEHCKPGFYGDATTGQPESCKKCACPNEGHSFSPTCVSAPNERGYVCNNCRQGYHGDFCQLCLPGFYGNPSIEGGSCQPCSCHPYGSLHGLCNNVTGACDCLQGVTGRDCSECSPRHAFMNRVCTSCDQGCYKDLMIMEDEMEAQLQGVENIADIKPIPRKRLQRLNNTAQSLNELLDTIKSSEDDAHSLIGGEDQENRYLKQAKIVEQEFQVLKDRNEDSIERLSTMKEELARYRTIVADHDQIVAGITNQLSQFSRDIGYQAPATGEIDYMVNEAENHLKNVKAQSEVLEKQYNYAKKNSEDADTLLKQILAEKLDSTTYDRLNEAEKKYRQLAKDFRNAIWDQARSKILTANELTGIIASRLDRLMNTIGQIQDVKEQLHGELDKSKSNVENLKALVNDINENYQTITEKSLPELRTQREQLLSLTQKHGNDPHEVLLVKAEQHAKKLEHEAYRLKHGLSETKHNSQNALSASKAYGEIIDALKNASAAAEKAKENADLSRTLASRSSTDSIVNSANATLAVSRTLEDTVLDAENKDEYAVEINKQLKDKLERLKALDLKANDNITQIKEAQNVLEDHNDRINNVFSTVNDADEETKNAESVVNEFADKVQKLNDRVQTVSNYGVRNINEQISNISVSRNHVESMVRSLQDVKNRASKHESQIKNIRRDLNVLKEKINEAREKASKIKIAVKADEDQTCSREYISPLNPSPSNSIILKYRPALDAPNSLIFFTSTQGTRTQSREYIAVELKSKKIHVRYNIGAGRRDATIAKRNIEYIPSSDRYTWYQIEVNRNGNTIRVSVVQKRVTGGDGAKDLDEPTEITIGEPDVTGDLIFNTVPGQTRIYIGHSNPQLTEELGLATNKFNGVLGEMILDGSNVPLWVFDSSSGNCDGSSGLPNIASVGHMFRNGFAQIRMPITERPNQMIIITLSAYSTNGLLYFRGSPETADFLAIQLEDGAIAVKARIAGSININLRSTRNDYADGRVHKIRTIRQGDEVHLQIDEADKVSTVVQKTAGTATEQVLNIPNSDHYVGGLPPDFNRQPFANDGIRFDGFFGCIQSVRPTQVSDLDLANPVRSQRKEAGCEFIDERLTPRDRIVGFSRPGYLLTKGIELGPKSSFSFNLRTKNTNAMLLYQAGNLKDKRRRIRGAEEDDTFIAIYLFKGQLITNLGTDSQDRLKRPTLTSSQTYNDGQLHSVFLARDNSQVLVRIDDREILTANLDDDKVIGTDRSLMFLGGFPDRGDGSEAQQQTDLGTSEPLIGCLSDFYLDYKKFPIIPEEHSATLGTCDLEYLDLNETSNRGAAEASLGRRHQLTLNMEQPDDNEFANSYYQRSHIARSTATCSVQTALSDKMGVDGARFGVSGSSHARLNFAQPYPDYNNFEIKFDLKTTQKNGLIWTWANYRNYTRYYFLTIERGFLKLEVKGHREPKSLRYRHLRVNNNEWHSVELKKEGRNFWIQIDELKREVIRDVPNPKVMRKRMYIGGVISKHRRQFKIPQVGFQGCLKNFQVDSVAQDLLSKSRDVIPCSYNLNTDYIHGGGFATFDELTKWSQQENVEISFDFKLNNAQKTVLFSIMTPENYRTTRLVLHVIDGELALNINVIKSQVSIDQKLGLPVCAGEWHRLTLKLGEILSHVQLNDQRSRAPLNFGQDALNELRRHQVHLGTPSAPLLTSMNATSFDGCVRNLQLDGSIALLSKAKKQSKVVANGCPN